MVIMQIIYLAINLIGTGGCLAFISSSDDFPFVADFFSFIGRRLGNVGLAIISTIVIALFIPTISFMAIVFAFLMLWGEHSR
jgi:hypothetical protein